MSNSKIPYSTRNYDDFRTAFIELTKKYYPDMQKSFNDASVGQWLIELLSAIGDDLSYHIDRTFQETSLDSASTTSSLLSIARNSGLKIPGKKGALCEVEISCELPLNEQSSTSTGSLRLADENYAPVLKRGTLFSTGFVTFELMENIDFSEQFNSDGYSDRKIEPVRDSNGNIINYKYTKLAVVVAGQSKIYKRTVESSDIKPFMEITLSDTDIMDVESIIVKPGINLNTDPSIDEFGVDSEEYLDKSGTTIQRFFEVDSLVDQYRYGYEVEGIDTSSVYDKSDIVDDGLYYSPIWEDLTYNDENGDEVTYRRLVKGQWKRLKNKFITEYTDNWKLKVIFGAGIRNEYGTIPTDAENFTQYLMSRMQANDYMGVLPDADSTIYILYRSGGGEETNIAAGSLTNIIYMNVSICGNSDDDENASKISAVKESLAVTNPTPSYGGKDEPSTEELRYLIKYNSAAQNRCVTIRDYYSRLAQLPAKYGCPFRVGIVEENNKIVIYALGMDYNGNLSNVLAETVADNMKEYLSGYKTICDFVEIKSGRVINLKFEIDIYVDKAYEKEEVVKEVIEEVMDYMDIRRHQMGEDIFLGDLQKEISNLDGVQNLIDMRVYNPVSDGYSDDEITQELVDISDCCYSDEYEESGTNYDRMIDLKKSDQTLYSDANSMFEILDENDITVKVKQRS